MPQSQKSWLITIVLATALGTTGAWVATAVAKSPTPPPAEAASGNQECAAFAIPFVHNPDNVKEGGRQGQALPEGWSAAGGGVIDGRPVVVACH